MNNREAFVEQTKILINGLLREAIGYTVKFQVPYYRGIVGYMVEAPLLWIRHSRFPIFFVAYDQRNPDVLSDIVTQLQMANVTEYFAILIVVPTQQGTGNEAEELRHIVANSVYHHDFVVLDHHHLRSIIAKNSSQRLIEIILTQGVEFSSLSPYVIKGPVPENMFFGREKEIKNISQTIHNRDYALVGGRRIGKSSTLLRLNRLLENDPRYFVAYLNCEEQFAVADFLAVIMDEFAHDAQEVSPMGMRNLVAELREAHQGKQIIFLLDEVDQLVNDDASTQDGRLFRTFRGLSQEGKCHFVFSGSRTLFNHLHDPQSPFFNFCQSVPLKPLSEKGVAEIIRKPMQQLGIDLPDEDALIDKVINLTSCHPSLVQWLCHRLLQDVNGRHVTASDLTAVAATPAFSEYFIETAWGEATPLEKILTMLVDKPQFELSELVESAAHYELNDKMKIRDGLRILEMYALVERQGQSYRFVLTQFPDVLRQVENVPFLIESMLTQVEV